MKEKEKEEKGRDSKVCVAYHTYSTGFFSNLRTSVVHLAFFPLEQSTKNPKQPLISHFLRLPIHGPLFSFIVLSSSRLFIVVSRFSVSTAARLLFGWSPYRGWSGTDQSDARCP